jgi:glycosyltransferase involved in cell wall biosynthesis
MMLESGLTSLKRDEHTLRMIKIMYLIRRAEGGMAQHLSDLIKGLDREIYDPVVVAPLGHKFGEFLAGYDVPVYDIDLTDRPNPITNIGAVFRLANVYDRVKPDLIHAHGHAAAMVGILAQRLKAPRKPVVVSIHNYPSYQRSRGLKRSVGSAAQRFLARRASRLIAVSEDIRQNMIAEEGLDPEKIITIHNGIELADLPRPPDEKDIAEIKARYGIRGNEKTVVSIGRLVAWKGFSVLIASAAALSETRDGFKVLIAGRGPEEENLNQQIRNLGKEDLIFMLGFVADTTPYFAMSDVFVVPSILEPFGLIVLQAMAAGCAVIGADAGGIPEIIKDGETGILVPPDNPIALSAAIDELLDDDERRRLLAEAAMKDIRERFPLEKMVDRTLAVYDECLRSSRSRL